MTTAAETPDLAELNELNKTNNANAPEFTFSGDGPTPEAVELYRKTFFDAEDEGREVPAGVLVGADVMPWQYQKDRAKYARRKDARRQLDTAIPELNAKAESFRREADDVAVAVRRPLGEWAIPDLLAILTGPDDKPLPPTSTMLDLAVAIQLYVSIKAMRLRDQAANAASIASEVRDRAMGELGQTASLETHHEINEAVELLRLAQQRIDGRKSILEVDTKIPACIAACARLARGEWVEDPKDRMEFPDIFNQPQRTPAEIRYRYLEKRRELNRLRTIAQQKPNALVQNASDARTIDALAKKITKLREAFLDVRNMAFSE